MNTLSLYGDAVTFTVFNKKILIFDILYGGQMKIKKYLFQDPELSITKIESEIFEWSDGMLLGLYYVADQCNSIITVEINQIKYLYEEYDFDVEKIFGTDSGVICMIDYSKISMFLDIFNYDKFVDYLNISQEMVYNYLKEIEMEIGNSFAIISTPGLGKGYEFDGSGSYIIENICLK